MEWLHMEVLNIWSQWMLLLVERFPDLSWTRRKPDHSRGHLRSGGVCWPELFSWIRSSLLRLSRSTTTSSRCKPLGPRRMRTLKISNKMVRHDHLGLQSFLNCGLRVTKAGINSCLFQNYDQCDQMVILFFNIWPLATMKISPII